MEVRCPNCSAHYDIDPSLVRSGSVRLQCSGCSRTFRLQLAGALPDGWMVRRKSDGKVLALDGLPTLQRWIVERRVGPEDELSRTGAQWKPLTAIVELAPFFEVVRKVEAPAPKGLDVDDLDSLFGGFSGSTGQAGSLDGSVEQSLASAFDESGTPREDAGADDLANVLLASLAQESERRPLSGVNQAISLQDVAPQSPQIVSTPISDVSAAVDTNPSIPLISLPRIDTPLPMSAVVHTPEPQPAEPPPGGSAPGPDFRLPDGHNAEDELDAFFDEPPRRGPGAALIAIVVVLVFGAIAAVLLSRTTPSDPASAEPAPESAATAQPAPPEEPASAAGDTTGEDGDATSPAEPEQLAEAAPTPVAPDAGGQGADSDVLPETEPAADNPAELASADGAVDANADDNTDDESDSGSDDAQTGTMRTGASNFVKKGDRAREQGHNAAAIEYYERALEARASNVDAQAGLGWCYLSSGAAARAAGYFETAIKLSPSYSKAYIGLAKAHQKDGKLEKAIATYESFIKKFPTASEVSIAKAQTEKLKEKLAEKKAAENKQPEPAKTADDPKPPVHTTTPSGTTPNGSGDGEKRIIIIHKAE